MRLSFVIARLFAQQTGGDDKVGVVRRLGNFYAARPTFIRVNRVILIAALAFLAAPSLRAEYVVLRSGLRLNVTGYQLIGNTYRLQMIGGTVEVPAAEVMAIEPEDIFIPIAKPVIPPVSGPFAIHQLGRDAF
jgi:hypothetical protein